MFKLIKDIDLFIFKHAIDGYCPLQDIICISTIDLILIVFWTSNSFITLIQILWMIIIHYLNGQHTFIDYSEVFYHWNWSSRTLFMRVSMNSICLSHKSDNNNNCYCKSAEIRHLHRHMMEKYDGAVAAVAAVPLQIYWFETCLISHLQFSRKWDFEFIISYNHQFWSTFPISVLQIKIYIQ